MKIVLTTIGSRGDIQPHIALGIALEQAGHNCFIATLPWAKSLIESYGLKHAAIGNNQVDMDGSVETIMRSSSTNSKGLFAALNFLFDTLRTCHTDMINLFNTVDLIIGHGVVGIPEAEMLKKPYVILSLEPMGLPKLKRRTGFFLTDYILNLPLKLMKSVFGKPYLQYRKDIGAPVYNHEREYPHPYLAILPVGNLLIEQNKQWKPKTEISGCFFAPTPVDYSPPSILENFLNQQGKPVFLSFGSMIFGESDQERIKQILLNTALQTGKKLIALTDYFPEEPYKLNENVLLVWRVPCSWLLSRVSLVIHHFGFSTTAEVLRNGLPSISVPFIFDQKMRARQLFRKGLSYKTLSFKKLTSAKLSTAIIDVLQNKSLQARLEEVATYIKNESGLKKAVELIETEFS